MCFRRFVWNSGEIRFLEEAQFNETSNNGLLPMKIRIHDDSIRLRLDRSEVDTIGKGRPVDCRTRFAGGAEFRYRLLSADCDAVSANYDDGRIEVRLPRSTATQWATDETEVSIRGENDVGDGAMSLLIEKDFECLDPRDGEDQSNRFVNPKAV